MLNFNIRLSSMLSYIEEHGQNFEESRVSDLETLVSECIELHKNPKVEGVSDSIYDVLYSTLREVNPESKFVTDIWEEGTGETDYTELLVKNPMLSILTAKSYTCREFIGWVSSLPKQPIEFFSSYKINGHGIRIVYENGYLVSATSRARSSKGNDITRQILYILPEYNEELSNYNLVEIRGELCLPFSNLDSARQYNPQIKSAFSAVASLVRPSTTEEECQLLDFLAYRCICDDLTFSTKSSEYEYLEEIGFSTPDYSIDVMSDVSTELPNILARFEEDYETSYDYFCDGVVVEINSRDLFYSLGIDGNHNIGNIAMKVGVWCQDQYVGYVQKVIFTKGKVKLSPVAIVSTNQDEAIVDEDDEILNYESLGVLTAQGNKVRRVPLYDVKNILILEAYPGRLLHFRYGGEAGVVPCFPDGSPLGEDAVLDFILEG